MAFVLATADRAADYARLLERLRRNPERTDVDVIKQQTAITTLNEQAREAITMLRQREHTSRISKFQEAAFRGDGTVRCAGHNDNVTFVHPTCA